MSTRTKLWIYFVVSSILSIVIFASYMIIYAALFNPGYSVSTFWALRSEIVEAIERNDAPDPAGIARLLQETEARYPGIRLEWLRADGGVVYSTAGRTEPYDVGEMIAAFAEMPYNLWEEDVHVSVMNEVTWNGDPHYLYLSLPSELVKSAQLYLYVRENRTLVDLATAVVLFLLTPILFTYVFLFNVNRRLRRLTRAMNQMDIRGSQMQIVDQSKDEIGQLSRRFNEMSRRINDQMQEIEAFQATRDTLIANLSHDLRTPLTMILGYAETIHGAPPDEQRQRLHRYAGIILQRSRYMAQLLERLLDVSRLQRGGFDPTFRATNLSELLRQIAAGYVSMVEEKGIAFDIEIPETDVTLAIDPELVERAVRNLIDNALEHGISGSYLGLTLAVFPRHVQIRVGDKGPGIASHDQEGIFDRFTRGEKGRLQYGFGLGLSIVKYVADAHRGAVYCSSIPGVETLFCLQLPRAVRSGPALAGAS